MQKSQKELISPDEYFMRAFEPDENVAGLGRQHLATFIGLIGFS